MNEWFAEVHKYVCKAHTFLLVFVVVALLLLLSLVTSSLGACFHVLAMCRDSTVFPVP